MLVWTYFVRRLDWIWRRRKKRPDYLHSVCARESFLSAKPIVVLPSRAIVPLALLERVRRRSSRSGDRRAANPKFGFSFKSPRKRFRESRDLSLQLSLEADYAENHLISPNRLSKNSRRGFYPQISQISTERPVSKFSRNLCSSVKSVDYFNSLLTNPISFLCVSSSRKCQATLCVSPTSFVGSCLAQ